jgi:DAK2 domain fusion protein YloV
VPHPLDAAAVRAWCGRAVRALGQVRAEVDASNVFPVADGDTGTNLCVTLESAARAVDEYAAGAPADTGPAGALAAMAHGALLGACGNSGTILAQLLRGMADALGEPGSGPDAGPGSRPDADAGADAAGAEALAGALDRAAVLARQAVARPVEGTMLSVASAAARAARARCGPGASAADVAGAAHEGARAALAVTPDQLPVLREAGVVDAGGAGLVTVLGALAEALGASTGAETGAAERTAAPQPGPYPCAGEAAAGEGYGEPGRLGYEVTYLLDAVDDAVPALRARLDGLGDSLVVVGGEGLWTVHVHVDDVGAAIEAGIEAGRPHRIRVTHFGDQTRAARRAAAGSRDDRAGAGADADADADDGGVRAGTRRAVVAVVNGPGLAALYREAGAVVLPAPPGAPPGPAELAEAVRRTGAREAVLLPNDAELREAAAGAAARARAAGTRVAVIPTRAAVQGIAALAVHEPGRRFDEDVVAMTAAAGATRYAELAVAEHRSWTSAGVCQAGDVLGLIDGDVAVIGADLAATARVVLDRMLAAGGELVTLVPGAAAPPGLVDRLAAHVRDRHLAVDTVVHPGGQHPCPLLIGVE